MFRGVGKREGDRKKRDVNNMQKSFNRIYDFFEEI